MTKWLVFGLIMLFAPIALACTSDGGDSEPTATPKPQPSRRGNKLIEGEISFKGVENRIGGATIYVRLEDISIEDDAGKTLVEQVIRDVTVDPSDLQTYRYLIEHRELEPKNTYRVRVHLDSDSSGDITEGDFAWTAPYHASYAVGSSVLNAINVTLEPVTVEQSEDTEALVRVEAPITDYELTTSPNDPNTYVLKVTSLQPNACARPNGYEAVRRLRDDDSIDVEVYNVRSCICRHRLRRSNRHRRVGNHDRHIPGAGYGCQRPHQRRRIPTHLGQPSQVRTNQCRCADTPNYSRYD